MMVNEKVFIVFLFHSIIIILFDVCVCVWDIERQQHPVGYEVMNIMDRNGLYGAHGEYHET